MSDGKHVRTQYNQDESLMGFLREYLNFIGVLTITMKIFHDQYFD